VPPADPLAQTLRWLLDELCVELGFCVPPEERVRLQAEPVVSVDALTDAVLAAEGMDPMICDKELRRLLRSKIDTRIGHLL
jgi:hypothetical protein